MNKDIVDIINEVIEHGEGRQNNPLQCILEKKLKNTSINNFINGKDNIFCCIYFWVQ